MSELSIRREQKKKKQKYRLQTQTTVVTMFFISFENVTLANKENHWQKSDVRVYCFVLETFNK